MGALRHRLLVIALIAIAAITVAGCGGDDNSAEPPQELEDTLGFLGGDNAKEIQARVENRIGDRHASPGLRVPAGRPVRAATGRHRQGSHHRRGVHQAVRLRDQHPAGQGQPAIRSQRTDSRRPSDRRPRRLRPRAGRRQSRRDLRRGCRQRRLQRAGRVHEGSERRRVRRRGHPQLPGRAAGRPRRAHHPGPADGQGQ